MLASMLVQPLTGDDLVKVFGTFFAGIAVVIYALKSTPGNSATPTNITSQISAIHQMLGNLLLAANPPVTTKQTTTTVEAPTNAGVTKSTTTTTSTTPIVPVVTSNTVNTAMVDTLPLGTPAIPTDGAPLPRP